LNALTDAGTAPQEVAGCHGARRRVGRGAEALRSIDVQRKLSALLEQLATGSAEPSGGEPIITQVALEE
jgi:hypothetical protein